GLPPTLHAEMPGPGGPRLLAVPHPPTGWGENRPALWGRGPRGPPPDGVAPFGALGRTREGNTAERRVVAHEQPRAPRRAPAGRAAPIHQDAVKPRTEPLGIVAARQRAVCPDERVL